VQDFNQLALFALPVAAGTQGQQVFSKAQPFFQSGAHMAEVFGRTSSLYIL
jgi:hypothetical protein